MKNLKIWDTTLRDGEQAPGFALNKTQKVDVARYLEEINVSTIEAGFPANQSHDFDSVRAVAEIIKNCEVAAFARAISGDIDLAVRALELAKSPVIIIGSPGYGPKLKSIGWNRDLGFQKAVQAVAYARKFVDEVSYGVEFATKTDLSYLFSLFQGAIEAGATRLLIADTTGVMLPDEFGKLVKEIRESVPGSYQLSVHCHNDLGLAVANSLSAIQNGADEVHVTANGLGERCGNASLETLAHALHIHREKLGASNDLDYLRIVYNIRMIADIFDIPILPTQPVVGKNAFSTAAGAHIKDAELYLEVDPQEVYGIPSQILSGAHSGSFTSGERRNNPMD